MRRSVLLCPCLCLFLLAPATASADLLQLYGQIRAGGGTGQGIAGDQKDADFFAKAAGPAYGFLVGLHVLIIDVWIQHDQFTDLSSVRGTWTQFMAGAGFSVAISEPPDKEQEPKWFLNLGFGAGFGVGTGQQIVPPLDNGQVSDKGFMAEGRLGIEYRASKVVSLGVSVPVTYGYLFKNDAPANDPTNQYQSVHAMAMMYLGLRLGL